MELEVDRVSYSSNHISGVKGEHIISTNSNREVGSRNDSSRGESDSDRETHFSIRINEVQKIVWRWSQERRIYRKDRRRRALLGENGRTKADN